MKLVEEFIEGKQVYVRPSYTLYKVLELFGEHNLRHLPVVDEDHVFIGLLSQEDFFDEYNQELTVGDNQREFLDVSTEPDVPVLIALRLLGEHELSMLPIVNEDNEYLGYVFPETILQYLVSKTSFREEGSSMTIAMMKRDYSLFEISRLIEENKANIITLFLEHINDDMINVHLSLDIQNLEYILRTFQRYDYRIIYYRDQTENDSYLDPDWNALNQYLNL